MIINIFFATTKENTAVYKIPWNIGEKFSLCYHRMLSILQNWFLLYTTHLYTLVAPFYRMQQYIIENETVCDACKIK